MKIVLIGPVYPYKGGIAHYTGFLCQALRKRHEVIMLSYKLQYPRFLFKKEQKDWSNNKFKVENVDYDINTVNPLNWLVTAINIKKKKPDLVIFQWWHPYFAPCYWVLCKLLGKQKILFTCHNVFPHERFPLDKLLTRMTLKNGNYFIVHSIQDEKDLMSIQSKAILKRTVLPTYNAFKMKNLTLNDGREQLKLDLSKKVLLFFGFIREYKGLKYLLKAMPIIIKQLSEVKLLIVGDFAGDKEDYLEIIKKLKLEDSVEIYDGYIPDEEVEQFFSATDLVVLPYESATQSGIVQIAYGFEKPVIVTNVGGLPEVVIDGKTGYVVEPKNEVALADKVIKFFNEKKANDFREGICEEAYKYSWDRMVEVIETLVQ